MTEARQDRLGIYLSAPFCRAKCAFCNFASGVFPGVDRNRYVERVIEDLEAAPERAVRLGLELPRTVDSIYVGGGTPTLLAPAQLERIFSALRACFDCLPEAEFTVECAPGFLSEPMLELLCASGVNRASLGVQSFVDREAALGGRLHTHESVAQDLRRLSAAGVENLNIDLIAGLPGQTLASWERSLAALVDSGAPHASIYMLEVDEDSRLGREALAQGARFHAREIPPEEAIVQMYERAIEYLAQAGLAQYEISNFARPGYESRHNLRYWRRSPYLGVGLEAASMLRAASGEGLREVARIKEPDEMEPYLAGSGPLECERLGPRAQLEEAWFLGLRTNAGVDLEELAREFGPGAVAEARAVLDSLEAAALLEAHGSRVRLTARGRLLSNEVFAEFLGLGPDGGA